MLVNSLLQILTMRILQCFYKILNISCWFSWVYYNFRFWGPNDIWMDLLKLVKSRVILINYFPLKSMHLWIWMSHFEQSLDLRNAKVSWAPWVVIGSSSSMSNIQEFLKCSVAIILLHGCLEERGEEFECCITHLFNINTQRSRFMEQRKGQLDFSSWIAWIVTNVHVLFLYLL